MVTSNIDFLGLEGKKGMRKRKKTLKTKESIHWCVPVSSRRGGCPSCWPSVYAQARTPPCTCWFLTLKTQGNNKEYTKYDNKHRRNPGVNSVKIFGFRRWIMKSMKYSISYSQGAILTCSFCGPFKFTSVRNTSRNNINRRSICNWEYI